MPQKARAYVRAGLPMGDDGDGAGIANRFLNRLRLNPVRQSSWLDLS